MPTLKTMPKTPEWLSAPARGSIGVDKENRVIQGYVLAQAGPFKSQGRGQFTAESLQRIVDLAAKHPLGLKSRFTHPTMSSDGLGKFLGRAQNIRLDGDRVRGDLHLADSSFNTPSGNLGQYVLDLAAEDPDALSSSLALMTEKLEVIDEHGRPKRDEKGDEVPPIWLPTALHASDIVDTGDACDGLLSVDALPDAVVRRATEMLDSLFDGQPWDVIEARCLAWLGRYKTLRCGEESSSVPVSVLMRKLKLQER